MFILVDGILMVTIHSATMVEVSMTLDIPTPMDMAVVLDLASTIGAGVGATVGTVATEEDIAEDSAMDLPMDTIMASTMVSLTAMLIVLQEAV